MNNSPSVGRGLIQSMFIYDDPYFYESIPKKFRKVRSGQTIYGVVRDKDRDSYTIISLALTGKQSVIISRNVAGRAREMIKFPNIPPFGKDDVFFSLSKAKRWWVNHYQNPNGRLPIRVITLGEYLREHNL